MSKRLRTFCLVGLIVSLVLAGVVLVARRRALLQAVTVSYTPLSGKAEWEGDWEFSELGADPSEDGDERVTIPFPGTDFALRVRRGDYRGYFFVSIDGEPANLLPQEERGAYLVLASPDGAPQVVTIPVASGMDDGDHVAEVVAERGWDQWPLAGWSASRVPDTTAHRWALAGLGALGFMFLAGAVWGAEERRSGGGRETRRHGDTETRRQGDRSYSLFPIPYSLFLAAVFYFSPWPLLTLVAGLALAVLVFLRLDLGLALVAAPAPFYLYPCALFGKVFSMVEIITLLCVLSWGVRRIANCELRIANCKFTNSLDLAALFFVLAAIGSLFVAEYRHVALRELRVLILEPALFYLVLRVARLDSKGIWRVVDFFVLGAAAVALIGLAQYALDVNVITAEEGFRRLRSIYGSPNSVGLYLGRALPVVVAVALFGASRGRRVAYGLAAVPLGLAILLSFSKGALMLGVPLSLLALGALAGGRWLWGSLGAVVATGVAAIPLLRAPRFASLFNAQSGSLFFRLHLWRSSWAMFRDHLWLGVGPDNFLYHYRSRYILPAAWQEPNLSQAHNILLDYGTRMGIVGLAAGGWLQVAFWRLALPLRRLTDPDRRALALGLMGSMVNFMAHGLVDASYFLLDLAFVFFLTLGLIQWLARSETDET